MRNAIIRAERLSRESFQDFGDVIETAGRDALLINQGTARRYDDLAAIDVAEKGGRPLVSLFQVQPTQLPVKLSLMERHPIASQAFFPLSPSPFLIVVAPAQEWPAASTIRAFLTNGRQGVNYRRGTWHHPVLAIEHATEFLILDRGDGGGNYEEIGLDDQDILVDGE